MTNYPTERQRKILWNVMTFAAVCGAGAIAVTLIVLLGRAVAFLQPVLIPFAVAAVLAYLLEPIVRVLTARTRLPRTAAVIVLFAVIALLIGLLLVSVVPQIYRQSASLAHDLPEYTKKAQTRLLSLLEASQKKLDQLDHLFPSAAKPSPGPAPDAGASPSPTASPAGSPTPAGTPVVTTAPPPAASPDPTPTATPEPTPTAAAEASPPPSGTSFSLSDATPEPFASPTVAGAPAASPSPGDAVASTSPTPGENRPLDTSAIRDYIQQRLPDFGKEAPAMLNSAWHMIYRSIGGVLGGLGILLNAIIIPVYLFFLLIESRHIARGWSGYLPMQDSPMKQEVVSVLTEINGYLVAFFRGQLIVSTIDGILIGSALYFLVHLDFSFFIALLVIVLTFIPYLGIILCYIPALLIAVVQYGDWWHPLLVVGIMFTVQTLEGFVIAPKIVGDSTGLHPMTVILSIFGWSLLLDGPIGAILAVPLTASLKVLLRRYVWERGANRVEDKAAVPISVAEAGGSSDGPGGEKKFLPPSVRPGLSENPPRTGTPLPPFPATPPPAPPEKKIDG